MSLIQAIKSYNANDLLNIGARAIYAGTITGASPSTVLETLPLERQAIVTTVCLSCDNATPVLVKLGYAINGGSMVEFFRAFVASGNSVSLSLPAYDWVFSPVSSTSDTVALVMSTSAGQVAYTVHTRIIATKVPLGYIEQIGAQTHANPYFGLESGKARGQSEF